MSQRDDDARVERIRRSFPALSQCVHGKPLVYLDNAATTQVPTSVMDAMTAHLETSNANVHRSGHLLGSRATEAVESTRAATARFIGAALADEVVFTSGATASLNMLARSLEPGVGPGDAVLVTMLEHHSNFVPWQMLCKRTGATFRVVPLDEHGDVDLEEFESLLARGDVRLVCLAHTSNVTGCVLPAAQMVRMAHAYGALAVVDAAQGMRHGCIDVQAMDCDFLAFSAHKMMGPTGVGVLYGRHDAWKSLEPCVYGGGMVDEVASAASTFSPVPHGFEAGTPNIVGIVGLGAAIVTLEDVGMQWIAAREKDMTDALLAALETIPGVNVMGRPAKRIGAVSFGVENCHPYDLASILDKEGVAVRAGNHCAQPQLEALGQRSVLRASPAFYNTNDEVERLVGALERAIAFLARYGEMG